VLTNPVPMGNTIFWECLFRKYFGELRISGCVYGPFLCDILFEFAAVVLIGSDFSFVFRFRP